ncbi:hypothetical protein D1007_59243 [Hordeum vulgare]|nr:hypothetical protein D1007_59243 [Hordeum vulgare]
MLQLPRTLPSPLPPSRSSTGKLKERLFPFLESLPVAFLESLVIAIASSPFLLHGELLLAASFLSAIELAMVMARSVPAREDWTLVSAEPTPAPTNPTSAPSRPTLAWLCSVGFAQFPDDRAVWVAETPLPEKKSTTFAARRPPVHQVTNPPPSTDSVLA